MRSVVLTLLLAGYISCMCLTDCNGNQVCCYGDVNSTINENNNYFLTTFGGGSDTQPMACGGTADGTWYYMADKQRWGCGAVMQIVNPSSGACVQAQVADVGPDICVEEAACFSIVDASPLVSSALGFGSSSGWSDSNEVNVTPAPNNNLGPC